VIGSVLYDAARVLYLASATSSLVIWTSDLTKPFKDQLLGSRNWEANVCVLKNCSLGSYNRIYEGILQKGIQDSLRPGRSRGRWWFGQEK